MAKLTLGHFDAAGRTLYGAFVRTDGTFAEAWFGWSSDCATADETPPSGDGTFAGSDPGRVLLNERAGGVNSTYWAGIPDDKADNTTEIPRGSDYDYEFQVWDDPAPGGGNLVAAYPVVMSDLSVNDLGQYPVQGTISAGDITLQQISDAIDTALTTRGKSGYSLGADGLDAIPIAEPTGRAATFPEMVALLYMRFFNDVTRSPTQIIVKKTGDVIATTQDITDTGDGNETQGAAF